MSNDKVRHRGKPAEPFAEVGAHGRITRTKEDGRLRITPKGHGLPAMAYVSWKDGEFFTWERLADLTFTKGKR
ncbi:hypothetical protein SEA_YEET_164 [Mycobacterium phage Yeet]|uniref:Uncharacterized protein n=4 Tax=Omegavirus TaxID=1623292 RepID=A0A3S9UB53_9CAUD|nr:hypothetical protein N860_gp166 [Mycobacterium phage Redno2]YP_008410559.1 hypothetical protein N857_gp170 [Mycobacterium phage Wanda]YP_009018167.1 hypothetical protein CL87_gp156 [Mycobacterium phage Thibault]YP_009124125.1 hypothetical protein VC71_gp172 [Mycobacterium phage Minerva]YP_009591027.1 hypothetical protein FDG54_gp171 [Mycobacterium phage Optimus]YP_009636349.1 hypothetical protein FGG20_gp178 [Mycobacterium phage Baka]ATN89888.1 hypothetical protein SEA_KLEIN_176 [Mycobacte